MNQLSGLFETVVAASTEASSHLKFSNMMLESIYLGYEPITASFGETLNVNIPTVDETDAVDIGGGDLQLSDTDHDTVPIVFDKHPSVSFLIRNWDQVRTPAQLREKYVQPKLEALVRKCNRHVADLVTAANFNRYDEITGGTNKFTLKNLAAMWSNLANEGVPVGDGNLQFITTPLVFAEMASDDDFAKEDIVGKDAAETARQQAVILPQFNARLKWDQQIPPAAAAKPAGILLHRYGIAMITANMPAADDSSVRETTIFPKPNFPVRVQMQYNLIKQGWVVHMHCGFGIKVVRPNFGSIGKGA